MFCAMFSVCECEFSGRMFFIHIYIKQSIFSYSIRAIRKLYLSDLIWVKQAPRLYDFLMLNSTEHEIYPAHKR